VRENENASKVKSVKQNGQRTSQRENQDKGAAQIKADQEKSWPALRWTFNRVAQTPNENNTAHALFLWKGKIKDLVLTCEPL
jgi:hypothetical protein